MSDAKQWQGRISEFFIDPENRNLRINWKLIYSDNHRNAALHISPWMDVLATAGETAMHAWPEAMPCDDDSSGEL